MEKPRRTSCLAFEGSPQIHAPKWGWRKAQLGASPQGSTAITPIPPFIVFCIANAAHNPFGSFWCLALPRCAHSSAALFIAPWSCPPSERVASHALIARKTSPELCHHVATLDCRNPVSNYVSGTDGRQRPQRRTQVSDARICVRALVEGFGHGCLA